MSKLLKPTSVQSRMVITAPQREGRCVSYHYNGALCCQTLNRYYHRGTFPSSSPQFKGLAVSRSAVHISAMLHDLDIR